LHIGYNKKRDKDMAKNNSRLMEIADELNKHIIAVKGALELAEDSAPNVELQNLLLKAIERMDNIHRLSNEMLGTLKHLFDKMDEMKTSKTDTEVKGQTKDK
jgi:DNA repair ATPase RecN